MQKAEAKGEGATPSLQWHVGANVAGQHNHFDFFLVGTPWGGGGRCGRLQQNKKVYSQLNPPRLWSTMNGLSTGYWVFCMLPACVDTKCTSRHPCMPLWSTPPRHLLTNGGE